MDSCKGQLTLRGVLIGCIGCIIITATSAYVALKMGALPWPIIFAAIVSLFFLKLLGNATKNEANVTHTVMSAGAMVAGGLAFTIPGIWILGAGDVSAFQMLAVALSGTILGLICTGALRRHYMEDACLEFPIGEAAAQTLIAGDTGGSVGKKLFGAMGFAGLYTALRDVFGIIPAMLFPSAALPGVAFGIYNSPMMLSVGFLVGGAAILAWLIGGVIGPLGIVAGGSSLGLWSVEVGQAVCSSLGMGVMMGCGIAVILKDILPKGLRMLKGRSAAVRTDAGKAGEKRASKLSLTLAVLGVAAAALMMCFVLDLGPVVSIVVVLVSWVTCAMAAQSVGQTGIDPMEIFGLIVLLIVAALSSLAQVQLFFVAAVVAVACGLAGDVMNDFHAGHVLGTSPTAQLIAQAIGGILGAFVAVAAMVVLLMAYGPEAFGPNGSFIAAQASVVATMVSGIPSIPAFALGLVAGMVLHFVGLPSMLVGLGIYLPFYMTFTAALGGLIKLVSEKVAAAKAKRTGSESAVHTMRESGLVIASGLLGGESIVGVIAALLAVATGLML